MGIKTRTSFQCTHGMKGTPTYHSWQSMKDRCLNPNSVTFYHYGGRGIEVCERWLHSFESFLADMGKRPDGMQLDRIDNDGNYEPSNCRWVTKKDNARNRNSSVFIVIDGKKLTAAEWSDITGVNAETIMARIKRGWEPILATTRPVDSRYSHRGSRNEVGV